MKLSSDGQWLNADQRLTMWQSMHHFGKVTKANTPKAGFMDSKPQITTSAKLEGTEEGEDGGVRMREREKTQRRVCW